MASNIDNLVRHSEVSEKAIERYLVERVKEMGGICLKYANSNMVGYPDRVALMPDGRTIWIELKSEGRQPSKIQVIRFKQMAAIGHAVHVADSKAAIDKILGRRCADAL